MLWDEKNSVSLCLNVSGRVHVSSAALRPVLSEQGYILHFLQLNYAS